MNLHAILVVTSLTAVAVTNSSVTAATLSIEQAEELSKKTGRPILAVAGSKT